MVCSNDDSSVINISKDDITINGFLVQYCDYKGSCEGEVNVNCLWKWDDRIHKWRDIVSDSIINITDLEEDDIDDKAYESEEIIWTT